jgi:hypothetical protein
MTTSHHYRRFFKESYTQKNESIQNNERTGSTKQQEKKKGRK